MTRVVVIEDSRTQAERLRLILEADGWSVRVFGDGLKGAEACLADPPDLVLSDILMPGLDGYGVCRRLAQSDATRHVPVVLLTSLGDPLDVVRALAAGAANFVTKPYKVPHLLARLRRTLSGESGTSLHLGGEDLHVAAGPERILHVLVAALEDAKARNEELAASHAALAASEAENRRLYREASEANRAKDEFLAVVSHEFRTPLNAVVGWVTLLREGGVEGEQAAKALETIERNAKSLSRLIDDVLDVSRIITGKLTIERRPTDLPAVVRGAVNSVGPQAEKKGVHLEASLEGGELRVSGDPERLGQVVLNLLTNAIKFTPPGGRVDVSLSRRGAAGDRASLSVTDTGKGISPEFLPYVFERFQQADASSSRQHTGLGLGLAIVKHLVELHGGDLQAESEGEGRGATFVVTLPCEPGRAEPIAPSAAADDRPLPSLAGLRVVVVDDDDDAREVLSFILAGRGADVRGAASAREGYALFEAFRPDVLVSDIGMPVENGLSFISRVRQHPLGKALPAIALSAYTDPQTARAAAAAGFDAHLGKPFDADAIVLAVATLRKA